MPLTYNISINPYNGQQVNTTQGGYYIGNSTININISNQPFTPITIDGNTAQLFYEIRWKGHFENWTDYYINGINWYPDQPNFYNNYQYGIQASNYSSTIVRWVRSASIPNSGTVDFEVKAQIGYTYLQYGNHAHLIPIGTTYQFITESDWSPTQTLTIPNTSPTANIPTTSPQLNETVIGILVAAVVLAIIITLMIYFRHRKTKSRKFD